MPNKPVLALRLVVEAKPETYRSLEVAEVVVPLVATNDCNVVEPATRSEELTVEEARERKPLYKPMMVVVACSPPACLVKGQEKVRAAGKAVRQSLERQRMVVEAY